MRVGRVWSRGVIDYLAEDERGFDLFLSCWFCIIALSCYIVFCKVADG